MEIKFSFDFKLKRRYVVNGKEYNSLDAMPVEVREAFRRSRGAEAALDADAGSLGPGSPLALTAGDPEADEAASRGVRQEPIHPGSSSSLSGLWLVVGLLALVVLFGLYYLLNSGGGR